MVRIKAVGEEQCAATYKANAGINESPLSLTEVMKWKPRFLEDREMLWRYIWQPL